MATIAELMVKIDTNNRGLMTGLNKAESRVAQFARRARQTIGVAFKVAVAGAVASLVGLTAGLAKASTEVDKLAKTAQKLGVGTEELQKLHLQARLSGVETNTLNMALQRMVRRVSEAAQGTGEAVKALKELGLDAAALNKLSPDKQFQRIAKAFGQVSGQADKVRLAMRLFDSEGVALVNTLGSDLDGVSKKFDALGLGISKSQAAAVESFNDSRAVLGAVFDDISGKVLAELAPSFQVVTDGITNWIKEMGGASAVASSIASTVTSTFSAIGAVIKDVIALYREFADLAGKVTGTASAIGQSIQDKTVAAFGAGRVASSQEDFSGGFFNAPFKIGDKIAQQSTQQNVKVQIQADKERLVNAVVADPQFNSAVQSAAEAATNNASRAVRR